MNTTTSNNVNTEQHSEFKNKECGFAAEYGFTKEHPSLSEKRKKAIAYLETRYVLHPQSTFTGCYNKH